MCFKALILKQFLVILTVLLGSFVVMGSTPIRGTEIRIMSFNMHHGEDKWGDSNLRSILRIIREEAPHIIALQSVDSLDDEGKVRYQLRQLAAQTGMYYDYGVSDSLGGGTFGVGFLSVWPFENRQVLNLPRSPAGEPRIMLCGLIVYSKSLTFRICNTKMESVSLFDRAMQAAYVNRALAESIQPVILAMDMGSRPNEQPYFSFKEKWLDAAKGSLLPTVAEGFPGDRLDYLMVLKANRVIIKDYKVIRKYPDISDHYPILATIEFLL